MLEVKVFKTEFIEEATWWYHLESFKVW